MAASRHFAPSSMRAVLFAVSCAVPMAVAPAGAEHGGFKDEVFSIIKKYCVECHRPGGAGHEKSGLDMSSYEGIMKGTWHGPVVVPGDAFTSNLNVLIEGRASPEIKMSHGGRKGPTKWECHLIRVWVNHGAKDN